MTALTKVSARFYRADTQQNQWMQALDLRLEHEWYVTILNIDFTTTSTVDADFFYELIRKSKTFDKDFWFPAIEHEGVLYVAGGVLKISDGKTFFFVPPRSVEDDHER